MGEFRQSTAVRDRGDEREHDVQQHTASSGIGAATARSLRLFFADGTPHGLVVAEIPNWSGKVLAAPRARLGELLNRDEAHRTGIYVLTGPDPEQLAGSMAYVGEADNVAARLRIHQRAGDKDFFDRLAIMVGSDDNLTKAHVRFIESRLIRLMRQVGSVVLSNGTDPDFQRLPEADRADMEFFVTQLALVLPILGFDLFRKPPSAVADGKVGLAAGQDDDATFVFSTAGATATGHETEDGFVVRVGSTARRTPTGTFPAGYLALRDRLVAEGKLVEGPTSDLSTFATDVVFSSPSAAASIVAARSASGPREWKLRSDGRMYKDWRGLASGSNPKIRGRFD